VGEFQAVPAKPIAVHIHGAEWGAGQHAVVFFRNPHTRTVAVPSRSKSSADRLAGELWRATAPSPNPGVDIGCVWLPGNRHLRGTSEMAVGRSNAREKESCQHPERVAHQASRRAR
jgi:hypothetical protein